MQSISHHVGLYALAWTLFGVLHSGMASRSFKGWWCRRLGRFAPWERAIFNGVALLSTLGVMALGRHLLPPVPLFDPQGGWRWGVGVVQGVGVVLLGWAALYYDLPRFAGWAQIRAARRGEELPPEPLLVSPFHRWVRHPLYATALVVIWARPWDLVTWWTNLFATAYLLVGMTLEERRLLSLYGTGYARFRERVPPLIPNPWRRLPPQWQPPAGEGRGVTGGSG